MGGEERKEGVVGRAPARRSGMMWNIIGGSGPGVAREGGQGRNAREKEKT